MNAYFDCVDLADPEEDSHVCETKIRLRPADDDLVRAISRKTRTPRAVVIRRILVGQLDRLSYGVGLDEILPDSDEAILPSGHGNRRPV